MGHEPQEHIRNPWYCSRPERRLIFFKQATWVPIIYVFFPESKGRELEDFDRLFAGEEEAALTESIAGGRDPTFCERNELKGGIAHEKEGAEGMV